MSAIGSARLRRVLERAAQPAPDAEERCDLCAAVLPPGPHRHMVDLESRRILCSCRACALLFDRRAAGGNHYRLVPERRRALAGFALDDARWAALRIPVDMAFFFRSTPAERVVALYPGPMGATESQLELDAWDDLVADNPVLEEMEPDVEALLVHRAGGARDHFLVPIDDCYRLVGTIRTSWKGLGGGDEVWRQIAEFFDQLRRQTE